MEEQDKNKKISYLYKEDDTIDVVMGEYNFLDKIDAGYHKVHGVESPFGSMRSMQKTKAPIFPGTAMAMLEEHLNVPLIKEYFSDTSKAIHKGLNMPLKMGIILEGKQGTGKSTIVLQLAKIFADMQETIIFIAQDAHDFLYINGFVAGIRKYGDERMIIILLDECDVPMEQNETTFKTILDSPTSHTNILYLFTTNYIEDIPDTIKDRPSRIKYVKNIDGISAPDVVFGIITGMNDTLEEKYQLTDKEMRNMTSKCIGKTVDEVKHAYLNSVFQFHMEREQLKAVAAEGIPEQRLPSDDEDNKLGASFTLDWPRFHRLNPFIKGSTGSTKKKRRSRRGGNSSTDD